MLVHVNKKRPIKMRQLRTELWYHSIVARRHLQGIGILKAIFEQSEEYRRGGGLSSTRFRGLKMREAGSEKCVSYRCAQDVPNNSDTVGGLGGVPGRGECRLRDGAGWQRLNLSLGWVQAI